jgi:hypothetical protein
VNVSLGAVMRAPRPRMATTVLGTGNYRYTHSTEDGRELVGTWWSHHGDAVISTAVGALVTGLISFIVVKYQRTFRRLSYSVIARQRLVPLTGYQEYSDLRIQFRSNPAGEPWIVIREPWIVIVRIINTGRQDIGPTDITKPISIDVGNDTIIRDARVTDSTPEDVYEAKPLEVDEMGRPFLAPVVVNRGNSIKIQLLLDGEPEKVTVVGRGVGIDMLTELEVQRRDEAASANARLRRANVVTVSLVILLVILIALYPPWRIQRTLPPQPAPSSAGCYPLTSTGNCYEPGEFCPNSDHGATGRAGDGATIICKYDHGWRWEPT